MVALRKVDAVTVPVPSLDAGIRFYCDALAHELKWRNDAVGQAGLSLPDTDTELVLTTRQRYEPDWLVDRLEDCIESFVRNGGQLVSEPATIPVGRVATVRDPFGNELVLIELSAGLYTTDEHGNVTGVHADSG